MINKIDKENLTKLIEYDNGVNWWKRDFFIKNVQDKIPGYLTVVSLPPDSENNYNCFVYALGLENDRDFLGGSNPIQQEFIKYLILNNKLTKAKEQNGSIVLYYDTKNNITHAGIMKDDNTVISKWMWGPVIENDFLDVPSSFGNRVVFMNKPDSDYIKNLYLEYKATGVEIKPIS